MTLKKLGVTVLTMCLGSSVWAAAPKPTPELREKGKDSYTRNCQACHGEKGDGLGPTGAYLNPKPRNFITEAFKKGIKPDEVFQTISVGMPGSSMVAFGGLPEEERWALTYYVLDFLPKQDKAAKQVKGTKKVKK